MHKRNVFISSVQKEFANERPITSFCVQVSGQVFGQATGEVTDHVTDHVTGHVNELILRLIIVLENKKSRPELMESLDLRHSGNFRDNYLNPAIEEGYIEMTIPDKPKSIKQKYQLTHKGIELKNRISKIK